MPKQHGDEAGRQDELPGGKPRRAGDDEFELAIREHEARHRREQDGEGQSALDDGRHAGQRDHQIDERIEIGALHGAAGELEIVDEGDQHEHDEEDDQRHLEEAAREIERERLVAHHGGQARPPDCWRRGSRRCSSSRTIDPTPSDAAKRKPFSVAASASAMPPSGRR